MIVVDTNVLAYLLIPGQYTESAERLLLDEPEWAAPLLWRSELRNVLATYVRSKRLEVSDALALHRRAADLIGAEEYNPETSDVLRLAKASGCSAYDCEFVSVAEYLDVKLVTADAKLAKAFKTRALLLSDA
ncbi:MAG: type II toxin-antitoxin system VapC family toxin [Candidatus Accumulibacter phosphatis]|uniref:Ribonuclease VapC n=2 Tax=Candidatus Accumulibacter TaxID=327159 RepID=A0A7D5SB42_9PROT|nr:MULTISPECIES: type II toxin-antitoxin system VapC family toxin [Candidatus Accumulibacter]QLH50720.1 MAG: type II toxin-antitoxin system VapC family toxin [Candidatus Accumulibacter cognatus]MBN8519963.1 type II toxin-antitoxin system VapC family toxin [Accumulibacter sp.]MBO3710343.1 type II toxin-antitoxin system VapC family toxin [Accumulibacter sp.]MCM8580639.1 type II toxin-antitoxin system VapC family toxin [Accumulibacter sp.]MCQ1548301.1 type II toxin-antitoxin system VapC family to